MTITLKAVYLVSEGSYIVTRGGYNLEVKGIIVEEYTFVVSDLSSILSVRKIPGELTHYVNDQGDTKSIEEFLKQKEELTSKGTIADEYMNDYDYNFSDLDDEYAYKLFTRTWKPVYGEERIEKEPVTVQITEIRTNSGDPDIKSLWNAPGMSNKSHLYSVNRLDFSVREFKDYCETFDLKYTLGGGNHSGIRFAQIDGHYLGFEDMGNFDRPFIGTLEQCKQEKELIKKCIETTVKLFIAKYRTKPGLKNAGEVLDDLYTILNRVSAIKPMKASWDTYTAALGSIEKLIKSVRQEIIEQ